MALVGKLWKDSRTDDPQPETPGRTTGGEEQQYNINVPSVRVTIDSYTPFQAHVISLLKSIDSRLKRIQDGLNRKR